MTLMTPLGYPPPTRSEPDARIFSAEGQAFLVGETLFLRGLEEEDAQRASAWREGPFPINAERAAEVIQERTKGAVPGQRFLVACRRSDGVPVGSLSSTRYPDNDPALDLKLHADPALPGADAIQAEMLRVFVGWAFDEGEVPLVRVGFDDDSEALIAAAQSLGMRHCATLREERWRNGSWRDTVIFEGYSPAWVRLVGEPDSGIAHAVAADAPGRWRRRASPTFGPTEGDPPANAVLVGPRVFLRSLELSDAAPVIAALRNDGETSFYDGGRWPGSVLAMRQHYRSIARADPQTTIRFAVCLRSTGEHIGTNGLYGVDYQHRTAGTETFFHDPASRDQGYGSEAKHLLLAYAFDRLNLHSVHSWVWGPNLRSAAALRKQGYRDAGRLGWAGTRGGVFTHGTYFDFLADEWREMATEAPASSRTSAPGTDTNLL